MHVTSYTFKYLLAQMAYEDPARFLSTFGGDGGWDYLHGVWNGVRREELGEDVELTDDLDIQVHGDVLLLVLPPPSARGHAIAVAVVGDSTQLRVFALERGDPEGSHPAFLVELSPGSRTNFGPQRESSLSSFAAQVAELAKSSP